MTNEISSNLSTIISCHASCHFFVLKTVLKRRQVMRLLIQHGADVNLRDSVGYSAADIIFNRWSGEVVET